MPDSEVVGKNADDYGECFAKDLLEQYKLIRVTITDAVNDRNTNNRFLIGICTALFGAEGFLLQTSLDGNLDKYPLALLSLMLFIVPILGIYISHLWVKWNNSYAIALRVRYRLLKGMEMHLPSQPFTREHVIRTEDGYTPVSDIIIRMAKFFMFAFIIMLVLSLIRLFFNN